MAEQPPLSPSGGGPGHNHHHDNPTMASLRHRRKAATVKRKRQLQQQRYACCVNLALGTVVVLLLFSNSIWAGLSGNTQDIGNRIGHHASSQRRNEAKYQVDEGEIIEPSSDSADREEEEVVEERLEEGEEGEENNPQAPNTEDAEHNPEEGEWVYMPPEDPYDPDEEDPIDRCRRDPTWRRPTTNYADCQRLMNWTPRDTWWRLDTNHNEYVLQGHEQDIHQCIARRFDAVYRKQPDALPWSRCNEEARDEACRVGQTRITSYYRNWLEGEAVMFADAFTEQEAFALQALQDCMFVYLPKELPWWEDRRFGGADKYNVVGGNEVAFVQGMVQVFTPGIAATLYRNFRMAYKEGKWATGGFGNLGYPPPNTLGIRTAEALQYHDAGQLGTHTDSDSVFTIAIHLCEEDTYSGGNFRLLSEHAFFKVPRLGAISFFADSDHGVTKVEGGDRKIFVVELWENDDAPPGSPRPDFKPWDVHMQKRWPIVTGAAEEYLDLEAYE